jgi:hypothetical protein
VIAFRIVAVGQFIADAKLESNHTKDFVLLHRVKKLFCLLFDEIFTILLMKHAGNVRWKFYAKQGLY